MLESVSKAYGFPLLRTWEYTGFNFSHVPNSKNYISEFNKKHGTSYKSVWTDRNGNITFFQMFNPDTVHPFTDLTGEANNRLDIIYTKLLNGLF